MNAVKEEQREQSAVLTVPEIAVPTAQRAITLVNRWLQKETAMLIHVTNATFNPVTYCWYLPIKLSYPDRGTIGEIGDIRALIGSSRCLTKSISRLNNPVYSVILTR